MPKSPTVSWTMAKAEWDWAKRVELNVGEWLAKGKPNGVTYFPPGLEQTVAMMINSATTKPDVKPYQCWYCGEMVSPPLCYHEGECPKSAVRTGTT